MKKTLSLLLATALPASIHCATIIESWQMNEGASTLMSSLTNDAGSAAFSTPDKPQAVTNGTGALEITIGADGGDNIFRNATLTSPDQATGIYEMQWRYLTATLNGGDATGANVGFGMRDSTANSDLFLVRLQRQNSRLLFQTRVGATNTTLDNFGSIITTIPEPLNVRVVADLDAETFDVFWKFDSDATEQSSTGIAFSAAGLEFDQVRMVANTNTNDMGATDKVEIDYLTVALIPEPSVTLLGLLGLGGLLPRRR